MDSLTKTRLTSFWFPTFLLMLATLTAYFGVFQLELIDYDDDRYIINNPRIQTGLTWESFQDSFQVHESNWHPVTWWSHMLDYALFELEPAGHHLTSLLFHCLNVLLLFQVLSRMTGATGRSIFVSALFALHPLHVESVAWVSERKDVLCTFFWLLCLGAYYDFTKYRRLWNQFWVLIFFGLGLMAKPMIVTLPFFLLLIDFWPLNRISLESIMKRPKKVWNLITEKIPLFFLSLLFILITLSVQQEALNPMHWKYRIGNAITAYVEYLGKTVWPKNLAVFYPHPGANLSPEKILLCFTILIVITFLVIHSIRKYPFIAMGWFWYMGTLVPVIGLVQVGSQALADRYTYMPLNGIFLILSWGGCAVLNHCNISKYWQSILAATLCLGLMIFTRFQVSNWENTHRLFEHAVHAVSGNYLAHHKLGNLLLEQGEIEKGLVHLQKAVEQAPHHPQFDFSLGNALVLNQRPEEAIQIFDRVISSDSSYWEAHLNKAQALSHLGRLDEAERELKIVLKKKPQSKKAYNNLGLLALNRKDFKKAVEFFRQAVSLGAKSAEAHNNLGIALTALKQFQEAASHYRTAIHLDPTLGEAHFNLANILVADSEFSKAVSHYKEALKIENERPEIYHNLGALLAKLGRKKEAMQYFKGALAAQPDFIPSQRALKNLKEF